MKWKFQLRTGLKNLKLTFGNWFPLTPPPPPHLNMGILDFSKFELSIKSSKLVSTDPPPPNGNFKCILFFGGLVNARTTLSPDRERLVYLMMCTHSVIGNKSNIFLHCKIVNVIILKNYTLFLSNLTDRSNFLIMKNFILLLVKPKSLANFSAKRSN